MVRNFWSFGAFQIVGFLIRVVQPVCLPSMMLKISEFVCVETRFQAYFELSVVEAGLISFPFLHCCSLRCAIMAVAFFKTVKDFLYLSFFYASVFLERLTVYAASAGQELGAVLSLLLSATIISR